ncbi:unnamed protein product [Schistosoma curassoni]|uniref:Reverse transcriptase domain-containing protein n=1 Tax=Schistosoma curassoni TaxID=6186 RepID=A0A183KE35_9TREM|nr:unnamed protein product [Schistosoma curassoni]
MDNTGYKDMGRHGLGERNENLERFANLCAFNKLVIGSTIFPHKRIHKATWTAPGHTTQNKIDHITSTKSSEGRWKTREPRATTAEKPAREGNMRELYDITKKLYGNHRKPEQTVKSKEGKVITNIEEQRNRCVEHFKELLNRPAPLNAPIIEAAHTDLPITVGSPAVEEISMAIRQIKNGKAAGPDNIPAEALKTYVAIWDEEQVPTDWKEGLLVKIPKKGDLSNCDNYSGITLLSMPGKVFNGVLLNRIKDSVDAQLRDQQAGFRKDRSCTDQIATLRIIVEQSIEWNSSLYINFIDY